MIIHINVRNQLDMLMWHSTPYFAIHMHHALRNKNKYHITSVLKTQFIYANLGKAPYSQNQIPIWGSPNPSAKGGLHL